MDLTMTERVGDRWEKMEGSRSTGQSPQWEEEEEEEEEGGGGGEEEETYKASLKSNVCTGFQSEIQQTSRL
jgi:hypothetical protein